MKIPRRADAEVGAPREEPPSDRTKRGHAPHNLGVLRNLALTILRQSTGAGITWEQRWRIIAKQPWRAQKLILPHAA